ncbi:MAG: hypothetical protein ABIO24_06845, partial [Saprospiraceae bacterium]
MKNLCSTLLILLAFATFATAQASFSITSTLVVGTAQVPEFTAAANDTVINLTNTAIPINWTRTIISISPNCEIQVCDPNNCYGAQISSKNFTIQPNGMGLMIVDLVDTLINMDGELDDPLVLGGQAATAIVQLKFTNLNAPADTVSAYFYMSITSTTGTHNPSSATRIVLYPNPVPEFFSLDQAEGVSHVRVFNLNGQQVAEYAATSGQ